MPRPELPLARIVERLGASRLATDPALARSALKDLFPADPQAVSVLAAAVEHGALIALTEADGSAPIEVLAPRLASDLRFATGVSDARARWAVGAWAIALGALEGPLPRLPRDGSEPDVAGLFAQRSGEFDVPTLLTPSVLDEDEPDAETLLRPTEDDSADATDDAGSTRSATAQEPQERDADDDTLRGGSTAGPGAAPAVTVPVSEDEETVLTTADTATATPEPESEATPEPESAATPEAEPEPEPEETVIRSGAAETSRALDDSDAATVTRSSGADTVQRVPAVSSRPPVTPTALVAPTSPATPPRERVVEERNPPAGRRRRRRLVLVAAIVVATLVIAGSVAALVLRPAERFSAFGAAARASVTQDGRTTSLRPGAAVDPGSTIAVTRGPLELRIGDSAVRLATASKARVGASETITVLAGRAYAHGGGGAGVDLRAGSTSVAVDQGRALVGCVSDAGCSFTALDEQITARSGSETIPLRAHERLAADGSETFVVPDALRADPWVKANDELDAAQHRTPLGITGRSVLGQWTLHLTRPDLPTALVRTVTFTRACDAAGCAIEAVTSTADNVTGRVLRGSVTTDSPSGDHLSVDYGSHSARCRYVPGVSRPGTVDGAETVMDALTFAGSAAGTSVTGSRETRYTPTGGACTGTAYTAAKTTTVAGRPGAPAATDLSVDAQQALLNYVASPGKGCELADGAPTTAMQADLRCTYAADEDAPTTVEYAVYDRTGATGTAYLAATSRFGLHDTGSCTSGPCEGRAPNGYGRFLLAKDGDAAVLITYDPRSARLLVIAHGPSMSGLSTWWREQQRSRSVYSASPIPRVGV